MHNNLKQLCIIINICLFASCSGQSDNGEGRERQQQSSSAEKRIEAQRSFLAKERKSIEAYIDDRGWTMERSGTGLYYSIEAGEGTVAVEPEDEVEYTFEIYLMNGQSAYSSEEEGSEKLVIDHQDAVIGLHEALKKMSLGDKGRFILPSHLAYGVAGDQDKIPPLTPLVYEIEIINIKK